jgi:L-aspartate oxidase
VSRAITEQMAKTRHPCVYLDLTHLDRKVVLERFPHIRSVCAEFGLDITRDQIPVRPGAHYMIGGLTVDLEGRTTLPGLWAAGEATATGLHGANRLGSNSLLEGLVFGRRTGLGASKRALETPDSYTALPLSAQWSNDAHQDDELNLTDLRNSLASLMWRNVGIVRDKAELEAAEEQVNFWDGYVSEREFTDPKGWELQNMLLVSRLVIAAARERRESRGVHNRSDYPDTDPKQAEHISLIAG